MASIYDALKSPLKPNTGLPTYSSNKEALAAGNGPVRYQKPSYTVVGDGSASSSSPVSSSPTYSAPTSQEEQSSGDSGGSSFDYEAYLRAKAEQEQAALNAQVEQKANELKNQYGSTNRQLYIQNQKNLKNLPQQLSALGLNGGASETTLGDLQKNYESNLNSNNDSLNTALAQLESARASGNSSILSSLYDSIASILAQRQSSSDELSNSMKLASYNAQLDSAAADKENAFKAYLQRLKNSTTSKTSSSDDDFAYGNSF